MPLSAIQVKNAQPKEKRYRLWDERSMYLEVTPAGGRYWMLKYRFGGKEKRLSLGVYPDVSLAKARERRDEARALLADGTDPSAHRKAQKAATEDTLKAVTEEWLAKEKVRLAGSTYDKTESLLRAHILPRLGSRPIATIEPPEVLAELRHLEDRGKYETAQRTKQITSRVFRYGIATGRCQRDPCADLRGALTTPKTRHRAAITDPREVGGLLRAIDGYTGQFTTLCALKLAALLFVRPGELRASEWQEFDLDAAAWRIPAERMKMRSAHLVPLSEQALAILRDLHPVTGHGRYLFHSVRSIRSPLSENTLNAALRRLGYTKEEMTAHGFRSMASTLLNELGWAPDIIERQLAHVERNKVRAAYNRAEYLEERRRMMQAWADYLDTLKQGGEVVAFRRNANGDE